MLAQDVLKSARFILSDTAAQRWTDERLLALLNDGLTDIAKTTILFVDTTYVELVNGVADYDFSTFAQKIIRIEYEDKPLTLTSHNELDKRRPDWQTQVGPKLKAYMLDKQREARVKFYPIPENQNNEVIDFGGSFGIITGVTYTDLVLNVENTFGDLGAVAEDGFVKVFYVRRHDKLTEITDELFVSDVAEEPLAHYVAGRALRDNQDTQNRTLGNEEINLYRQQLSEYSMERAKNFTQTNYAVPYRPLGD